MILLAYLSLSDKAYQKACHQEWTMDIPEWSIFSAYKCKESKRIRVFFAKDFSPAVCLYTPPSGTPFRCSYEVFGCYKSQSYDWSHWSPVLYPCTFPARISIRPWRSRSVFPPWRCLSAHILLSCLSVCDAPWGSWRKRRWRIVTPCPSGVWYRKGCRRPHHWLVFR